MSRLNSSEPWLRLGEGNVWFASARRRKAGGPAMRCMLPRRLLAKARCWAVLCIVPAICWAGPIYMIENPDGSTRFTNKPPGSGISAKVFTARRGGFSTYRSMRRPRYFTTEYREIIHRHATAFKLDPALVRAVIHAESAFNPQAVSRRGALGLMQLMPDVAKSLDVQNPFRPDENVRGGCRYLSQLLSQYRGNVRLALAAYNAGPGAVQRYGGVPPYSETVEYVKRVLELQQRYRRVSHE